MVWRNGLDRNSFCPKVGQVGHCLTWGKAEVGTQVCVCAGGGLALGGGGSRPVTDWWRKLADHVGPRFGV